MQAARGRHRRVGAQDEGDVHERPDVESDPQLHLAFKLMSEYGMRNSEAGRAKKDWIKDLIQLICYHFLTGGKPTRDN